MPELFWPFDPKLVREWPGERPEGWAPHIGTDWPVAQGTPLRATASGVVDIIWDDGLGAWVIDIYCPDGTVVRNGHMSHMAPKDGAWVNAGDYIGNTGGTLNTPGAGLSTGAHFHWELRTNGGWGAEPGEWYDPRDLSINTFAGTGSAYSKPTIHGMENDMIIFYAHALGKDKPGWLVVGYTPKPLILSTQAAANDWQARIGKKTIQTGYAGFRKYLRSAGGSAVQLARVAKSA